MDESNLETYIIEHIISLDQLREMFPDIPFQRITDRIATIQLPPDSARAIREALMSAGVGVFRPLLLGLNIQEVLSEVNISQLHNFPFDGLRGENILIGFVDTGIDYTNELFKYEDNTSRIVSIWDQTIEGNPPIDLPEGSNYGSVYSNEQINEALNSPDPYSIVPSRDTNGHGTYLAGVAAGNDRTGNTNYVGGAPESGIVMVKLKPANSRLKEYHFLDDDAIAFQANDLMSGINYLLSVAEKMNRPMAICIALGSNEGPHDGFTILERYLSVVSSIYNVILVSSAGNEAALAHHYSNVILPTQSQTFEINIPEQENGFIFTLWARGGDKLAMGFTTPLGNGISKVPIEFSALQTFSFNLETSQITFDYEFPNLITGSQSIEIRLINPTPGIWRFTVYGDFVIDGTYNLWLPREGFIAEGTRFLQPDPYTTVCIPSTAERLLVIGAYNSYDNSLYAASGRGPTANRIIKPDLIAPGVNIPGPNLQGGFSLQTGTGAATAIATAACALLLQWAVVEGNFRIINTNIARIILIRGAQRDPNSTYPNPLEGHGKLDLQNSINLV